MRNVITLAIILLSLLAIGCAGYRASSDQTPIEIIADRQNYTPLMSSTVGIGLMPEYPSNVSNGTAAFHWHTDYGYFLSWGVRGNEVEYLGPDVSTDDKKVYWSYSPADMDKEKPPVRITLSMIDKDSGKVLNKTSLEIEWDNRGMAGVKR